MRLIDADVLIEEFKKWLPKEGSEWLQCDIHPLENLCVSAILTIEEQPTVEAKPVVHGEWKFNHFYGEWECSECGSLIALSDDENGHANFCPNCGADMRKKV